MNFASFQSIAANTKLKNSSARIISDDGESLQAVKSASISNAVSRLFNVTKAAHGSIEVNHAIRQQLAYAVADKLGIRASSYQDMLSKIQKELGANVFDADLFTNGFWGGKPLTARRITKIVNATINKLNHTIVSDSPSESIKADVPEDNLADDMSNGSASVDDGIEMGRSSNQTEGAKDASQAESLENGERYIPLSHLSNLSFGAEKTVKSKLKGLKLDLTKGMTVEYESAYSNVRVSKSEAKKKLNDVQFTAMGQGRKMNAEFRKAIQSNDSLVIEDIDGGKQQHKSLHDIFTLGSTVVTGAGLLDMIDKFRKVVDEASRSDNISESDRKILDAELDRLDDLRNRTTRLSTDSNDWHDITSCLSELIELHQLAISQPASDSRGDSRSGK